MFRKSGDILLLDELEDQSFLWIHLDILSVLRQDLIFILFVIKKAIWSDLSTKVGISEISIV